MTLLDIIGKSVTDAAFLLEVKQAIVEQRGLGADEAKKLYDMLIEERHRVDDGELSQSCRLLVDVHTRMDMRDGDKFHIVDRAPIFGISWINIREYSKAWAVLRHIARI